MSVDGETSRVMKGVQHGACDYLLKPIRMKELRNIWQHVFRKKIHEVRDIESHEGIEEFEMMRNGSDQSDDGYFLCGGDLTLGKKRKDVENKQDEKDYGDPSSLKKARVVWTVDLHQKFVKAVNQIGFDSKFIINSPSQTSCILIVSVISSPTYFHFKYAGHFCFVIKVGFNSVAVIFIMRF